MKAKDLSEHIAGTYALLRITLVVVGFLLPLGLWIGGRIWGVGDARHTLADSMSAYYWDGGDPTRNYFVGSLYVIGAVLLSYKGFTDREDWVLNVAGLLAIGVAMFPKGGIGFTIPIGPKGMDFTVHYACAVTFFLCIGYVCIFESCATLDLIPERDPRKALYRGAYCILGVAMVVLPVGAWVIRVILPKTYQYIFWAELAGVYVFATYWLLKSLEIRQTEADRMAALGMLTTEPADDSLIAQETFNIIQPDATEHAEPAEPAKPATWRDRVFAKPLRKMNK